MFVQLPRDARKGCAVPLELGLQVVVSYPTWVLGILLLCQSTPLLFREAIFFN